MSGSREIRKAGSRPCCGAGLTPATNYWLRFDLARSRMTEAPGRPVGRIAMDMKLSPEQQKLRHAARELAEAEFAAKAAEIDRTEAYPYDNVAALKAAGFMGYTIPTSHGGRGG